MDSKAKWKITTEEKERYIDALTEELPTLRAKADISQDDLANMSGQSKGNIAKSLKKLEEDGYIEREVNPENRRKYMLKTTSKGDEFVPKFRQISKDWEKEVGITEDDQELIERIKEIALNNMKLVEDL